MIIYNTLSDLQNGIVRTIDTRNNKIIILDNISLKNEMIDKLVATATFSADPQAQDYARHLIYRLAQLRDIYPASINDLYMAVGRGEVSGFTVPAINIRLMTYDTARVVFKLMLKHNMGPVLFEIARSEMQYTFQQPAEYTTSILAAAIKEGYKGPVFLQGDHFQFSPAKFKEDAHAETQRLKDLVEESLAAGFFNIDIDASTLVDLSKQDLNEQQYINYTKTAELTHFIRSLQPEGVTVSIGGEIGHIGGVNSNVADFEAFMNGYIKEIQGSNLTGISKVSVQTGTSHGGTPLAGGKIAEVNLDFNVLKDIGEVARTKYHMGGAVQHGASTLPNQLFNKFPEVRTLEIHLATGFQNIIFESMPQAVRDMMYGWVKDNTQDEWKADQTEEQNIYKTRKKAIGPFKKELWSLTDSQKEPIREALAKQFEDVFTKLNVLNTREYAEKYAIYAKNVELFHKTKNNGEQVKVDDLSD